jgi:double-stranded uracil-DNA glycosylase
MELETYDILLNGLPVVFCGINPSVRAATQGMETGSRLNGWQLPTGMQCLAK